MKITILGAHNMELLNTRLSSIMIDETLVVDAGGLTSCLPLTTQLGLKALLITHCHYDHIRDIPAFAINLVFAGNTVDMYATKQAYDVISDHLLDGTIYPNFTESPPENPVIRINFIEPLKPANILDYHILAVPVNHSVPTVGYQITSSDGKTVFITSDTGPGLTDCWKQVSPQLLLIEVTQSNKFEFPGHLTPDLLRQELILFKDTKGYLPEVVTVHMRPQLEDEIRVELGEVADELNCRITPGYEGMEISL